MSNLKAVEELENHGKPDPIVGDLVDYEQICSWILSCEHSHGDRCCKAEYAEGVHLKDFRLIDVANYRIIDAPSNARYFALSYMWGGVAQLQLLTQKRDEMASIGFLRQYWDEIPQTIQDAMHFVAGCQETYLWVDSLCIVQDNTDMKYAQMGQMGAIYNGSVATLIAGMGKSANAGLAGVRLGTREPERSQPQYHNLYLIQNGIDDYLSFRKPRDGTPFVDMGRRVKAKQLNLGDRLAASDHNTRAWTYQEVILSRRCIYFMENMVYFNCRRNICAENKFSPYTQSTEHIRSLSLFIEDPIFSGNPISFQRTLGSIYTRVVKEYTRKALTYDSDILHAFSGIAAAMEKACSWPFTAGLPEPILDYALLWSPTKRSLGRHPEVDEFPSWSWAGWRGEAVYSEIERFEVGYEPFLAKTKSLVTQWTIYGPNGIRTIPSALPIDSKANDLDKSGASLEQALTCLSNRTGALRNPRNLLIFRAITIPFNAQATLICDKWLSKFNTDWSAANREKFTFESKGFQTGHLIGTGKLGIPISDPDASTFDLVFLSITKSADGEFQEWNEKDKYPNVMLIEWKGDIAERVAVGLLYAKNLDVPDDGKKWKTIILA